MVRDELCVSKEGILLRGQRIVMPKSLRSSVVALAHAGHQGIVKSKALIRSRVWFPGIDAMVERKVRQCIACQANSDRPSYEPLRPSPMPPRPWHTVSGDFFGPMDDGTYWFVNLCEGSRWVKVDSVTACSETQVEFVLNQLFAEFGAPLIYKSDNGSPFMSHGFKAFAAKWGFTHRKITPEWPRANAEVESFMKKLGKVLKTAKVMGVNKHDALQEFLRVYRETPHSTTGIPPNVLMFGYSHSSGIPAVESGVKKEVRYEEALVNDAAAKTRLKAEYDRRMNVKEAQIRVGSLVLIKLARHRKNTSAWDIRPYRVTAVKGSMVTATRPDHTITRNSSQFKLFRPDEYESSTHPVHGDSCGAERQIPKREGEEETAKGVRTQENTEQRAEEEQSNTSEEQLSAEGKQSAIGKTQPCRGRPTKEQAAVNKAK